MCLRRLRVNSFFSARCVSCLKNRDETCRENPLENGFWNQKKFVSKLLITPERGYL